MDFNWRLYVDYLPELLDALLLTVYLTVITTVASTLLGLPLAVARDSKSTVLAGAVAVFSWLTRTTPVLVVLFMAFYGLPALGVSMDSLTIAIIGLSVQCTGYNLEIIRGGLRAVAREQYDAIRALGLPRVRAWVAVILRQSVPAAAPAYFSNVTQILKTTSIASAITVREITGETTNLIGITYAAIEMLVIAAVLYVILASVMILLQSITERWVALP